MKWPGQRNGLIPAKLMVDVGGGKLMHPAAALSWKRMVAAANKATRGTVYIASWQDAYRSLARQIMFWLRHLSGKGNLAARPGTSNHGWGLAADVHYSSARVKAWMFANADDHDWKPDPSEDWHWNYVGSLTTASTGVQLPLLLDREVTMFFFSTYEVRGKSTKKSLAFYTFDGHTVVDLPPGHEHSFKLALGRSKRVTEVTIQRLRSQGARHAPATVTNNPTSLGPVLDAIGSLPAVVNDEADKRARSRLAL